MKYEIKSVSHEEESLVKSLVIWYQTKLQSGKA
jgi:hypothetical protein